MVQIFGKIQVDNTGILYFQVFHLSQIVNEYQSWYHQLKVSFLKASNYGITKYPDNTRVAKTVDITESSVLLFMKMIEYDVNFYKQCFNSSLFVTLEKMKINGTDYNNEKDLESFLLSKINKDKNAKKEFVYVPKITFDKRIIMHHKNNRQQQATISEEDDTNSNVFGNKNESKKEVINILQEQDLELK